MSDDAPRATTPSLSGLSYEEKVDEILRIVRGLADTAVEHDAKIKFVAAQVDINTEDDHVLAARVRKLERLGEETKTAVEQLTTALDLQKRIIRDHDKSIHALQDDEERRTTYAGDR